MKPSLRCEVGRLREARDLVWDLSIEIQESHALIQALRADLEYQWSVSHAEHCDDVWPHGEGEWCDWPLPSSLRGLTADV